MVKTTLKKKLGERIRFFRKENKLIQAKLGLLVDRTEETISNIERGLHFPKPEILEPLAKALKVSVEDLFSFPIVKGKRENSGTKTLLLRDLLSLTYSLNEKEIIYMIKQAKGLKDLK